MKLTRYAVSRQRACHPCSEAKARCDRKAPQCTRCATRGLSCRYPRRHPPKGSGSEHDDAASSSASPGHRPVEEPAASGGSEKLDFSKLDLVCPIEPGDISNRWLNSFVPVPGQKPKDYPPTITAFIYRVLKAYASSAVHGRGVPPFVHAAQLADAARAPLSTCLGLVRICDSVLPEGEQAAVGVLQREMTSLYEGHEGYGDDLALLSAFQAYLIYSLVLFFRPTADPDANQFLRRAMMCLQDLACSSSRGGLVCRAEQRNERPAWEDWIVAEAKRRTLFVMYLLDSLLLSRDQLPTFLGTELHGLPAPSGKALWGAAGRHEWHLDYNIYLAQWPDGGLAIDELWPIGADPDEAAVSARRRRVDQWLECLDEYGTMMYAVTICTHGG